MRFVLSSAVLGSPPTWTTTNTKETEMTVTVIDVNAAHPYHVRIGSHLVPEIAELGGRFRNVGIVYQESVSYFVAEIAAALRENGSTVHLFPVPDAEAGKTLVVAEELWIKCGKAGITRADVIMGVGGGAATDLAGFIASTWMRGIAFISCPTSLLGMVDAGVGGKTGINNAIGKNLVGTFHEPQGVFIDLHVLYTLPRSEIVSGMAEVVKCGFIADQRILELVEDNPAAVFDVDGPVLHELVCRSVQVKADVVSCDLRESGLRENLNYGHTLAHAIEQREHYLWRHGNAVAVGMVFAAALARTAGLLNEADVNRTRDIVSAVGLPTSYDAEALDELISTMYSDKKNRTGVLRFVVLDGFGNPVRMENPTQEQLAAAYAEVSKQ